LKSSVKRREDLLCQRQLPCAAAARRCPLRAGVPVAIPRRPCASLFLRGSTEPQLPALRRRTTQRPAADQNAAWERRRRTSRSRPIGAPLPLAEPHT